MPESSNLTHVMCLQKKLISAVIVSNTNIKTEMEKESMPFCDYFGCLF